MHGSLTVLTGTLMSKWRQRRFYVSRSGVTVYL